MVIRTEELTKYYGKSRGVEEINLSVKEGEVFGFLGPNGSGKTTTIRILLDFIRASSGRARLFGMDAHADSIRIKSRIGYLPGEYGMYEKMTAVEYLQFLASLRSDEKPPLKDRLIELFGLDVSRRIKSFSHGNKQKLGLVQAFMHDPELLILDEPTNGLDPLIQQRLYELILELKERGKTIFFSSHILSEVERVCDRVGILREGKLVALHEISDLKKVRLKTIEITFKQELDESIFNLEGVRKIKKNAHTIRLWIDANINNILRIISQYPIDNISCRDASLEDIFLEYYSQ
ncbi:MAG: ABC transporter ATP-binding protein [Planctomycetota bacterium]|jgi:ABC-2 type transport system ATP-binding protein